MSNLSVFLIRVVLGGLFAVILTRFFYPDVGLVKVIGLAVFLVLLSYMFSYMRNKDSDS